MMPTCREQLIHQLQCEGAFTEQGATELADAYRTEALAAAVGRLRAVPLTCTALTGPVWYGTGWKDCITTREDIADYQRPDGEAYPGELQRLRALNHGLRAALLRRDDVGWARQQLVSHAEHEAKARAEAGEPA